MSGWTFFLSPAPPTQTPSATVPTRVLISGMCSFLLSRSLSFSELFLPLCWPCFFFLFISLRFVFVSYLSNGFTIGNPFELLPRVLFIFKKCMLSAKGLLSRENIMNIHRVLFSALSSFVGCFGSTRWNPMFSSETGRNWLKHIGLTGWNMVHDHTNCANCSLSVQYFETLQNNGLTLSFSFATHTHTIWRKYLICIRFASCKINNGIHLRDKAKRENMRWTIQYCRSIHSPFS